MCCTQASCWVALSGAGFFPEVQSLSVPLYGEQFRQFPINAEIMSLLESCHLRVLDYFPQEKLYAFYRTSQVVYRLHSSTEYQGWDNHHNRKLYSPVLSCTHHGKTRVGKIQFFDVLRIGYDSILVFYLFNYLFVQDLPVQGNPVQVNAFAVK